MKPDVDTDLSLIFLDNMFVDDYAFFVPTRFFCSFSSEEVKEEVKSYES